MRTRTCAAISRIRREWPEGERLFPPMNNLTERGRPFVEGGDGMMLVGTQLTIDGKPMPRDGRRCGRFLLARRAPADRRPGRFRAADVASPAWHVQDPKMRAPGNGAVFVGSKGYMATTARGEGVWLLPASRWAEYKLPPQMLTASGRQPPAGLDSLLQGRRARCLGIRRSDEVHRVAVAGRDRSPRPRKADVGREQAALQQQRRSQPLPQAVPPQGMGTEGLAPAFMTRTRPRHIFAFLLAAASAWAQRAPIPQQLSFTPYRAS